MRIKKFLGVLCLVSFLVISLTSFAGAEKTTLTVWDWHSPRMDIVKPYLVEYSKLHPGIEFKTMVVPKGEYWKKLLAGAMAKQAPTDLLFFHNSATSTHGGFLEPFPEDLFPLSEMREEYYNLDQSVVLSDGKMRFFPGGIMVSVIWYNTDMWSETGLGATPKTWEDFREAANKLTKYNEKGEIERSGFAFTGNFLHHLWQTFLYQQGGWLYAKDGAAADSSWVESPGVKSLTFIEELIDDKVTERGFHFMESFGLQQSAMTFTYGYFRMHLNYTYPDVKFGVFPVPSETGKWTPALGRNNYECDWAVLEAAPEEKKREAFKFIKWLYEQDDYIVELNYTLSRIAGKKSIWTRPEIVSDPILSIMAEIVPYTVFPGEYGTVDLPMSGLETRIFQGMSVEEALRITKADVDAALKEKPVEWNVERQYQVPAK